jgi:hypothetical protein
MDPQDDGRTREVLFVFCERFLYVELFELADRLVEEYVAFQHFVDQGFKSGTHDQSESTSSEKILASDDGTVAEPAARSEPNLHLPNRTCRFRTKSYSCFR